LQDVLDGLTHDPVRAMYVTPPIELYDAIVPKIDPALGERGRAAIPIRAPRSADRSRALPRNR
jgi:hypothetical protein